MHTRNLSVVVFVAALLACSESDPYRAPPSGEPNDTIAQATPIPTGTPVAAVIGSPMDVDYYAFMVPAGGAFVRIQTFDVTGTTCDAADPYVELYSAGGSLLDWDDNSGPNLCDDLYVWEPEGTYYAAIGYSSGVAEAFEYALLITLTAGSVGDSAESEPNGSVGTADGPYTVDALVTGSLSSSSDFDYFAVTNPSAVSRTVYLETFEGSIGYCPTADSTLAVYNATGVQLAYNDDAGISYCSYLSYTIPAYTTYYVRVGGWSGDTFSYLLEIDLL